MDFTSLQTLVYHLLNYPGWYTHNVFQILCKHNWERREGNICIELQQRNPPDRAAGEEPPGIGQGPQWKVWRFLRKLHQTVQWECLRAVETGHHRVHLIPRWRGDTGQASLFLQKSTDPHRRHLGPLQRKRSWQIQRHWQPHHVRWLQVCPLLHQWYYWIRYIEFDVIRVPQSLVHFRALEYSDQLYELLNKNHMFQNGDRQEIEIRGCSIHAVELICQQLKLSETTLQVNSTVIDFFLWEYRRRFAADLARIPYHKVRCIYYWLLNWNANYNSEYSIISISDWFHVEVIWPLTSIRRWNKRRELDPFVALTICQSEAVDSTPTSATTAFMIAPSFPYRRHQITGRRHLRRSVLRFG